MGIVRELFAALSVLALVLSACGAGGTSATVNESATESSTTEPAIDVTSTTKLTDDPPSPIPSSYFERIGELRRDMIGSHADSFSGLWLEEALYVFVAFTECSDEELREVAEALPAITGNIICFEHPYTFAELSVARERIWDAYNGENEDPILSQLRQYELSGGFNEKAGHLVFTTPDAREVREILLQVFPAGMVQVIEGTTPTTVLD